MYCQELEGTCGFKHLKLAGDVRGCGFESHRRAVLIGSDCSPETGENPFLVLPPTEQLSPFLDSSAGKFVETLYREVL